MTKKPNKFSGKITQNLSKTVAAVALVASVATPNIAFGQNQNAASNIVTTTDVNNFCAKISSLSESLGKRMSERVGTYESRKQDRISKVKVRQADRNKKITDKRGEWDVDRTKHFADLKAQAKTEAQINAVSAYESAIQSAVNTKRAKVDAAIKTYNDGINALVNKRVDGLDGAVDSFKSSIDSAIIQAKNACANGEDPAKAKADLKAVVDANTNSLKGSVKLLPEVKSAVEKLQADRKAAVSVAEMNFKTAIKQAQVNLKEAFKA